MAKFRDWYEISFCLKTLPAFENNRKLRSGLEGKKIEIRCCAHWYNVAVWTGEALATSLSQKLYLHFHRRISRSGRLLSNLAKFIGKNLCWSLYFRTYSLQLCQKSELVQVFPSEFCYFSQNMFFIEHLRTIASVIGHPALFAPDQKR